MTWGRVIGESTYSPRQGSLTNAASGSRRQRQSNEVILDEWQDRGNSPSSARRLSPEPDDWRGPEDASRSRRRPRSLDRSEDPAVSEWGDTRPSKDVRDEFEENPYGRQGAGRHPSSDSVAGDWAIVNSPAASRGLMRDEFDGPSREIRRPRHSKERRRRTPSSDRRVSEDAERRAQIGRRYVGTEDRRERLWTEITKDLVVREAIERAGYEFEETEFFYYIFDYLQYVRLLISLDGSADVDRTMFPRLSTFPTIFARRGVGASMRFIASARLCHLQQCLRPEDPLHCCWIEDRLLALGDGRPWSEGWPSTTADAGLCRVLNGRQQSTAWSGQRFRFSLAAPIAQVLVVKHCPVVA